MEIDSNEELGSYEYHKLTSTEFKLKEKIMYKEYIDCLKKHQLAIEWAVLYKYLQFLFLKLECKDVNIISDFLDLLIW